MNNYDNNDNRKSLEAEFAYTVEMIKYAQFFDEFVESLWCNSERKGNMGTNSELASTLITFIGGAILPTIYKGEIYKFLQTASGMAITELSEVIKLEVKRFKADRVIQAFIKIQQKLSEAGIEAKEINLDKILLPIIQGLSIEENLSVQEMYTGLLSAAIAGEEVMFDEIHILKNIGTKEILVLEILVEKKSLDREHILTSCNLTTDKFEITVDRLIAKGLVKPTSLENTETWRTSLASAITRDRGAAEYVGGETLRGADLDAIETALESTIQAIIDLQTTEKYRSIGLTEMGRNFMQKCKGIITRSVETEQNL